MKSSKKSQTFPYKIRKFNPETDTKKPFDCGDNDLNGFLLENNNQIPNATHYSEELLAETYILEDDKDNIIAYFSLLNDKIERTIDNNREWNRLSRKIPNAKRRSSHPAVKNRDYLKWKNSTD